jgi:quinol monooxygenase YgiN
MSIYRIGSFQARADLVQDMQDFLYSIMPLIQSAEGCEAVQLFQNQEDPTKFTMIEVWDSIESHRASVKNIPTEKLAEIGPLLAAAPSGNYYNLLHEISA